MANDSAQISAKELRKSQNPEMESRILWESAKWGSLWLLGAAGAMYYINYRVPFVRRLQLPYKVFTVACVGSGAFWTVLDKQAMIEDRKFAQQFSITKPVEETKEAFKINFDTLPDQLYQNRFKLVLGIWAATMGVALTYNFARRDITRAQKLINSRMVAQAAGIAGFGGIAAVSQWKPSGAVTSN
ncbi:hypothetical protein HK098_004044 [Nowakowskiella sp. JEL0407]|nr:hypothetical protein HK098_004044 [Nowakowskiella sp. JEL0407]